MVSGYRNWGAFELRILLTGGAGFIGSALTPEILKQGHRVTVLDNLSWGIQGLSANFDKPGFGFVEGDIRDDKLVSSLLEKNDVVVHLAALVGCNLCDSQKAEAMDVNVNGSKTLDRYLSDDQLLIFASTGSVYGQVYGLDCTEKTTPNPQSHYALTKVEAESIFAKRNNTIILRFATAFGVSSRMRLDLLVNQFVYEAVKNKKLTVYGKDYIRSVIHIRDIARSFIFAVKNRDFMAGQVFNVSSTGLSFTKKQIAERIKKQIDYSLQFAESDADGDGRNYYLSSEKIESLGYRANVSLDQGITELIDNIKGLKIEKRFFNG